VPAATLSDRPPVILLGLDAAEIDVVDRLVAAGRIPNCSTWIPRGCRWIRSGTRSMSYRLAILDLPYATELRTHAYMMALNGWQGTPPGRIS